MDWSLGRLEEARLMSSNLKVNLVTQLSQLSVAHSNITCLRLCDVMGTMDLKLLL